MKFTKYGKPIDAEARFWLKQTKDGIFFGMGYMCGRHNLDLPKNIQEQVAHDYWKENWKKIIPSNANIISNKMVLPTDEQCRLLQDSVKEYVGIGLNNKPKISRTGIKIIINEFLKMNQ